MGMKIINVKMNEPIKSLGKLSACIGYFDGLHKGHMQLVNKAIQNAKENNCLSCLITFDPDPVVIVKNLDFRKHLTPLERKLDIAKNTGIDVVVVLNMTKEMSMLDPKDFINSILVALNIEYLVCGYDFRFGFKGAGDTEALKEYGKEYFSTQVIEPVVFDNQKISSTRIIEALNQGDVQLVSILLNRPYSIKSKVVHGRKQGRKIGFPTINLEYNEEYYTPKEGVYAGVGIVDGQAYRAMTNVGHNLTFNHTEQLSIEAFLLDFDNDVYGKEVEILFTHRLRDELKFDTIEELIEQMKDDEKQTINKVSVQMLKSLV